MPKTTSLPPNWTLVLEQIQDSLTQAIHLAQSREAALADPGVAAAALLPPDNVAKHLADLEKHVQPMEARLVGLDRTLQSEEEHVRRHLAMVADLSHRLAEWTAGAIG